MSTVTPAVICSTAQTAQIPAAETENQSQKVLRQRFSVLELKDKQHLCVSTDVLIYFIYLFLCGKMSRQILKTEELSGQSRRSCRRALSGRDPRQYQSAYSPQQSIVSVGRSVGRSVADLLTVLTSVRRASAGPLT